MIAFVDGLSQNEPIDATYKMAFERLILGKKPLITRSFSIVSFSLFAMTIRLLLVIDKKIHVSH